MSETSEMPPEANKAPEATKAQAPRAPMDSPLPRSITVRQHAPIIFWWPVWVIGFLFAIVSFFFGEQVEVGGQTMWFHPSRNLGVIYLSVFAIIFFRTNVVLRGITSLTVIIAILAAVLLISFLGWWDRLFSLEQHLSVHMDAGYYLVSSIVLLVFWVGAILIFDQFTYCEFRPGQLIIRNLMTAGTRTFDTRGMSIYKVQDDRLRHLVLGLGTGDLHIATTGAEAVTLDIRNVAFVDSKLKIIKRLIAMSPDELSET